MPIQAISGADRVVSSAITQGLEEYLAHVETYNTIARKLAQAAARKNESEMRVLSLLEKDAADREAEQRRRIALADLEAGIERSKADTLIPPTPELLAKGDFISRKIADKQWADGALSGYRRVQISQIVLLHGRGVLSDETFAATKWYRDRYEAAQMDAKAPVARYGETVRGDPVYGHLPSTEWAAEAREDIRDARSFIPNDILPMFDAVVLEDIGMKDAAKLKRLRYANFSAAFKLATERLYDGISHRLSMIGR
jgi:hypothetical protein